MAAPTKQTPPVKGDVESAASWVVPTPPTEKTPLWEPDGEPEESQAEGSTLQWWMFLVLLVSCLSSAVGVPYMAFGLFSRSLGEKTGLSEDATTLILNSGMVGGLVLTFVPGILYDAYGYKFMVAFGGVFSVAGALTWFFYLSQGGTSMVPLALGYFMQAFGARSQFLTGQVASMNVFPAGFASSVSATLAVCVSGGYVMLPVTWKALFQDTEAPTALPIGRFHGFLACIFCFNTLAGLAISPLMRGTAARKSSQKAAEKAKPRDRSRFPQLVSMDGLTLLTMVTLSRTLFIVYVSAGCTAVGEEALGDLTASERDSQVASVLGNVGGFGMAGRFVLGFGADFLQLVPEAGRAAPWLCLVTAASMSTVVYATYWIQYAESGATDPLMWKVGSCILGFAYGGFGAIFPATIRMLFPADMGLVLGGFTSYTGILNIVYSMLFVKMHWAAGVWEIFCLGAVVSTIVLCSTTWRYWGVAP